MSNYWKKEFPTILFIFISGIVFNVGLPMIAIWQGKIIDSVLMGTKFEAIVKQLAIFLLVVLTIQIVRFVKRYLVRLFANRTMATMRTEIYHHIMHQSIATLSEEDAGELMTKAVSDVDICVEGMRKFTTEVFDTGVLMAAYLVYLCTYDIKITLAACIFIPVAVYLAERGKVKIVAYSKQYRAQAGRVSSFTLSHLEHISLLRIHGIEKESLGHFEKELKTLEKSAVRANLLENSMQPIYQVISMFGILFILYQGGEKVLQQTWTIGMFTAYITMFAALAVKASKASKLFNTVQKSSVSWMRIKPYFQEVQAKSREESNHNTAPEIADAMTTKMLEVRNLSFSYPEQKEDIVGGISFAAERGSIIGITGPVACGKSSLGIALEGLYEYRGTIAINGKELRNYLPEERRKLISYMGHRPSLLSDSIYDNITMGEGGDISGVLKDICFEEEIQNMPEGIHTKVGNGGIALSGGQQARIALARALYRKTPLIILDDPFSAVDAKTEAKMIAALGEHYQDSVILLISHRLFCFPTLKHVFMMHADGSYLFSNHQELLSDDPYAQIYITQKGGAQHEKEFYKQDN